jgi:hypothetical protein
MNVLRTKNTRNKPVIITGKVWLAGSTTLYSRIESTMAANTDTISVGYMKMNFGYGTSMIRCGPDDLEDSDFLTAL